MARGKRTVCGLGPIVVEEDERTARRLKRRAVAAQGLSFIDNSSRNIALATGIVKSSECDEGRPEKSIDLERNFVLIDDDDDCEVYGARPMGFSDGSVDDADYVAFLDFLASEQCGDSDVSYDCRRIVESSVVNGSAADGHAVDRGVIEETEDGLGGATGISVDDGVVSIEIFDDSTAHYKSIEGGAFDAAQVDDVRSDGLATVHHDGSDVRCVGGCSDANVDDLNSRPKDDCVADGSFVDGCAGLNGGNLSTGSSDDNCGGRCDYDDGFSDVDPSCKMFLDNLRVDGKTYVVEFPLSNNVSLLIRYETDDEPHSACRLVNLETDKHCLKREVTERGKVLRRGVRKQIETQSVSRTENDGTCKKLKDTPVAKRRSLFENPLEKGACDPSACRVNGRANKKLRLEASSHSRSTRVEIQSDSIAGRIDTGAKLRNFQAVERKNAPVARDRQKELTDLVSRRANGHTGKCRSLKVCCRKGPNGANPLLLDRDYEIFLNSRQKDGGNQVLMPNKVTGSVRGRKRNQSDSQRRNMETQTKSRDVRVKERAIAVVKREVQTKAADPVPFRAREGTSEKSSLDARASANCKHECMPKLDMVNRSYQDTGKSLNKDRRPGVLKPESGTKVTHKSDNDSSSDLEVLESGTDPFCGEYNSPFVTSKLFIHDEDDMGCKESCGDGRFALFRKRLIEVIERPYDEKECKELYKKVCCRKPVERERHLRSSTKRYTSGSLGKSYLDHHSDFAKEIHSAIENPHKLLSLLRGFFYWLQVMENNALLMNQLNKNILLDPCNRKESGAWFFMDK